MIKNRLTVVVSVGSYIIQELDIILTKLQELLSI